MRHFLGQAVFFCLLAGASAQAQPGTGNPYRYSLDFAHRLVTKADVLVFVGQDGEAVDGRVEPILKARPLPLQGLGVTPNRVAYRTKESTSWEIPPFAELDPAPPSDASPALKRLYAERLAHKAGPPPSTFATLSLSASGAPSILLRPRKVTELHQLLRPQDAELHPPFSAVRFDVGNYGVLQLSLYGGTNSFDAEEAYLALRNCVEAKEPLEGLGKEAFLATLKQQPEAPPVTRPGVVPFRNLPVQGTPHPEWIDPNAQMGMKAPAFRDLPTPRTKLEGSLLPSKPKEYKSKLPEYRVLVVYIPEKAITMELDIDARMGTTQDFINLGVALTQRIFQAN